MSSKSKELAISDIRSCEETTSTGIVVINIDDERTKYDDMTITMSKHIDIRRRKLKFTVATVFSFQSAVHFSYLACTGATVESGVLGPRGKSQMDVLKEITRER